MAEGTVEVVRTGASLARGKSRQDYGTPPAFIAAVEKRFGRIGWDLAATRENSVATVNLPHEHRYFGPDHNHPNYRDALAADRSWEITMSSGPYWLNPPFADIAPWAAKCAEYRDRPVWTLMLTPASIGTDWFREHIQDKALVLGLSPRLTFVGTSDPYPKDLMLSCFGFGVCGFDTWRWDSAPKPLDVGEGAR